MESLAAYIKARELAFTKTNISSGWSGAGLIPFQPRKLIRRVQPITPSPPSTPLPQHNPFGNAFLASPLSTFQLSKLPTLH